MLSDAQRGSFWAYPFSKKKNHIFASISMVMLIHYEILVHVDRVLVDLVFLCIFVYVDLSELYIKSLTVGHLTTAFNLGEQVVNL